MKIVLTNLWFAPDGNRRRPGEHSVPDAWEKLLPKTAKVLVGPKPAKAEPAPEPTAPAGAGGKK